MRAIGLMLSLLVVTGGIATGQATPSVPPLFSRSDLALLALSAAADATDQAITRRGYDNSSLITREQDPLARPFVTHGTAVQAVSGAVLFAAEAGVVALLNKKGHRRLAHLFLETCIAGNTFGAINTARQYQGK